MSKQLALQFSLPEKADIESYHSSANHQAVRNLEACARGDGEPYLYLWGPSGSGKSHLLQAATRIAEKSGRSALYIPLDQAVQLSPELFDNLEQLDLICLDDIQEVAGLPVWEQGVFNLFNRLRDNGRSLLISSRCSPLNLPLKLADLKSRLSWGLCYQLQTMSDQEKTTTLIQEAARRGLEMNHECARYIMRHAPRDMHSLKQLLEQLDKASLEAQRRLTVPFIKQFMQQQTGLS